MPNYKRPVPSSRLLKTLLLFIPKLAHGSGPHARDFEIIGINGHSPLKSFFYGLNSIKSSRSDRQLQLLPVKLICGCWVHYGLVRHTTVTYLILGVLQKDPLLFRNDCDQYTGLAEASLTRFVT